jgi:hypothetical protein
MGLDHGITKHLELVELRRVSVDLGRDQHGHANNTTNPALHHEL